MPPPLSNFDLDQLEIRVSKGMVVPYRDMRALIAMARRYNQSLAAIQNYGSQAHEQAPGPQR